MIKYLCCKVGEITHAHISPSFKLSRSRERKTTCSYGISNIFILRYILLPTSLFYL